MRDDFREVIIRIQIGSLMRRGATSQAFGAIASRWHAARGHVPQKGHGYVNRTAWTREIGFAGWGNRHNRRRQRYGADGNIPRSALLQTQTPRSVRRHIMQPQVEPEHSETKPEPERSETKRGHRCSSCGKQGHNVRTCPK